MKQNAKLSCTTGFQQATVNQMMFSYAVVGYLDAWFIDEKEKKINKGNQTKIEFSE